MLRFQWSHLDIKNPDDVDMFQHLLQVHNPRVGALDTETTGLHIIQDKPFVVILGWHQPGTNQGWTFTVDLEKYPYVGKQVLDIWFEKSKSFELLLGHNLKFDLHMLYNIGYNYTEHTNLADTQHYIRFAHDSLQASEGGPPLGLKDYATRYITPSARNFDKEIQTERMVIAKRYNGQLKNKLGITMRQLADAFSDPIFEVSDLPDETRTLYLDWLHSLPLPIQHKVESWVETDHIPYNMVDRNILLKYAHQDVVLTLEVYYQTSPIVVNRQQETGLDIENQLILPFFRMERVGFQVNEQYLEESRVRLKQYIIERRELLCNITKEKINIGQHAKIKEFLEKEYGIQCKSSGASELDMLKNNLDYPEAVRFISLVQELRTLEKWYSVYITRFQKELVASNRIYTQINQVGAVSGRITSNLQQFPKDPIKKEDGSELFHPRRMIKAKTGTKMVFIDYSQIELRVQAFYTMLVGHPDRNMIRAYMPYECQERNNKFYLQEAPQTEWHSTDIHGATTEQATGLKPDHPDFKRLRTEIGKRVNFAKNYGAQLGKIIEMFPEKTKDECIRINDAYYKAFPGVKEYHKYCERSASQRAATKNLFGISYYNTSGHKLKNLLIQGSAAYFLKLKIIEIDEYLKPLQSKIQMQIHDELVFEWSDSNEHLVAIKEIMERWDDCQIPIVAEISESHTNWAEKKEMT